MTTDKDEELIPAKRAMRPYMPEISTAILHTLDRNGELKLIKIGGHLYGKRGAINRWLESKRGALAD